MQKRKEGKQEAGYEVLYEEGEGSSPQVERRRKGNWHVTAAEYRPSMRDRLRNANLTGVTSSLSAEGAELTAGVKLGRLAR